MALKAILESIDDLPEDVKSEYTKKKVKVGSEEKEVYVLDIEGFQTHPEAASLKVALDRQKQENKTLKDEKKALEDKVKDLPEDWSRDEWDRLLALDIDPTDPDADKKRKAKEDERFANQRKQFEQRIATLQKEKDDAIAERDAKIEQERKARAEERAETQLTEALSKSGIKPELMKAAKALHKSFVKHELTDDEGLRVFIETDMGEQEISAYIENWSKSDEGKAFVVPPSGGGSNGNARPGTVLAGDNPFTSGAWSKTQQAKLLQSDRNKAERLAKAAGFGNLDLAIKASHAITQEKA